jgi:two-component system sensor histidine kinase BaeS
MKLKLIHKLLIAMFACTAMVLVLISLVTRASIGRGFEDFLHQQERNQIELLVPELVEWYSGHGNWDGLASNPREFYTLVFSALLKGSETRLGTDPGRMQAPFADGRRPRNAAGPGPGSRGPGQAGPRGGPGPGQGRFNALPQRIFLLDGKKAPVIGEVPPDYMEDDLLPVTINNDKVGWLGVASIRGIQLPEEEAFIATMRNNLLIGLGLGLAVAALLAWLLARHLSRPVNDVAQGIRSLAAGDYKQKIDARGGDEIARLSDDVNRLSSALGEHETARKRWMSDMAHELRTPLSIISGELEAMSDGIRPLDKEQLDSVREEVKNLSALVDDLHNLALTDSGALAYKMRTVNLEEFVQLSIDSIRGRAAEKNLKLIYNKPDQDVSVLGDEKRLRQLLRNLMDNAVRYTDINGQISVKVLKNGHEAQMTISDTAPGASAEECERLFDRLYRMESSRNRNSGGSGLGLAICRNIVEAHGGQITAEPGPDGGLMITTTLPLGI